MATENTNGENRRNVLKLLGAAGVAGATGFGINEMLSGSDNSGAEPDTYSEDPDDYGDSGNSTDSDKDTEDPPEQQIDLEAALDVNYGEIPHTGEELSFTSSVNNEYLEQNNLTEDDLEYEVTVDIEDVSDQYLFEQDGELPMDNAGTYEVEATVTHGDEQDTATEEFEVYEREKLFVYESEQELQDELGDKDGAIEWCVGGTNNDDPDDRILAYIDADAIEYALEPEHYEGVDPADVLTTKEKRATLADIEPFATDTYALDVVKSNRSGNKGTYVSINSHDGYVTLNRSGAEKLAEEISADDIERSRKMFEC